LDEEKLFKKNN